MKKILLLGLFALFMSTGVMAWELIPLSVNYENEQPLGNGYTKTPTLADHPEYVLYIKDENNNVVYTTTVYSTQTQVILPSTLSGDYQIELVVDNLLYKGLIEL